MRRQITAFTRLEVQLAQPELEGVRGVATVDLYLDGASLLQLLTDYERAALASTVPLALAGHYGRPRLNQDLADLLTPQAAGRGRARRAPLLDCYCGRAGCWPLLAEIHRSGSRIRWSGFSHGRQDHARWRSVDYSGFGPFTFDAMLYVSALDQIRVWSRAGRASGALAGSVAQER